MAETGLRDLELRMERMHNALTRQEEELQSWRHKSARLPNWIRNGGITMFIALFAQSMTAVWWASEITNTQQNILSDVKVNTEYRIASTERYNEIMIETKLLRLGHVSFDFLQKIYFKDSLLVEATVGCGCLEANTFNPLPLPKKLYAGMKTLL